MPDREKVLTWLETCGKDNICSGNCPYSENGFGEYGQCRESLMADAYDLLKEQEAQLVLNIGEQISCKSGSCPRCGKMLNTTCNKRYCGDCGQAVKWE